MKILKKLSFSLVFAILLLISVPEFYRQPLFAQSHPKAVQKIEEIVYITRTGHKYHRPSCRYLRYSAIPIEKSEAQELYAPCKVCRP